MKKHLFVLLGAFLFSSHLYAKDLVLSCKFDPDANSILGQFSEVIE